MNRGNELILVDRELAYRLERTIALDGVECVAAMGRRFPSELAACEEIGGGYALYCGAGSPLTHALAIGLGGAVTSSELLRMEEFYRSRCCAVNVEISPFADQSIVEFVRERPYRLTEFNQIFVADLNELTLDNIARDRIQVREAGPSDAETAISVLSEGFGGGGSLSPATIRTAESLYYMNGGSYFLAWIDGEAVGAGGLSVRDGVASIYGACTLPRHRGRGVQTALLRARLSQAASVGCDLATVGTAPGSASERNVQRAGFRLAYTKTIMIREWEDQNG